MHKSECSGAGSEWEWEGESRRGVAWAGSTMSLPMNGGGRKTHTLSLSLSLSLISSPSLPSLSALFSLSPSLPTCILSPLSTINIGWLMRLEEGITSPNESFSWNSCTIPNNLVYLARLKGAELVDSQCKEAFSNSEALRLSRRLLGSVERGRPAE